jgi:signal peptidase I
MLKHRSKWVAAILSILTPSGLAQLYNVQPKKGAFFFASYWAIILVTLFTGVALSFYAMCVLVFASILLIIASLVDSIRSAGQPMQLKAFNRWYVYLLFYMVMIFSYASVKNIAVVESFKIPSAAMYPTIIIGDRIMVDKRETTRRELQRGDLIVFLYPADKNKSFFKRVIGFPGDRVRTEGTDLYLNGKKLAHVLVKSENEETVFSELLGNHYYEVSYLPYRSFVDQEYVVPDGHLFMMGDNRDNSVDSREYGFVPMSDVTGRAAYIYWSTNFKRIGQSLTTK